MQATADERQENERAERDPAGPGDGGRLQREEAEGGETGDDAGADDTQRRIGSTQAATPEPDAALEQEMVSERCGAAEAAGDQSGNGGHRDTVGTRVEA